MNYEQSSVVPRIEAVYQSLTPLEKTIGDFFISNTTESDFSARHISERLFVSEATLSRFAKKCGFPGYREFVYAYRSEKAYPAGKITAGFTLEVFDTYQELLTKSYSLIDPVQIQRVADMLNKKSRVFVYGVGSSGFAANEMKLRFMRVGVDIEAVTDVQIMKMNAVILDQNCLVFGISVSGETTEVIQALKSARKQRAATILITAHKKPQMKQYCDEIILIALKERLQNGNAISPQFPVLVMQDVIFASFLQVDRDAKEAKHAFTLQQINRQDR